MKYTNIKKLLIKFMGGGLINFPTRFLRWIKIDGDAEGDDGGSGGSTEIDYEAIYQFYKNKLIEATPQEFLESAIIPEHYAFIEIGHGPSSEYENKFGIWYSDSQVSDETGKILFCETNSNFEIVKYIYLGNYNFIQPQI